MLRTDYDLAPCVGAQPWSYGVNVARHTRACSVGNGPIFFCKESMREP